MQEQMRAILPTKCMPSSTIMNFRVWSPVNLAMSAMIQQGMEQLDKLHHFCKFVCCFGYFNLDDEKFAFSY